LFFFGSGSRIGNGFDEAMMHHFFEKKKSLYSSKKQESFRRLLYLSVFFSLIHVNFSGNL